MRGQGLFASVVQEVGEIIVAEVDKHRVRALVTDRAALKALIARQ
jgi:isocitrate lyase